MTSEVRRPPFPAYKGEHDYIFVSYAHADSAWVYPEIEQLNDGGINLWYDEGIEGGTSWADELASFIDSSRGVIFFASDFAVASPNVINEIHYAIGLKKPVLIVSEQPTDLPGGLKLALGHQQAIIRQDLSPVSFQSKLLISTEKMLGITDESKRAASVAALTADKPPVSGGHERTTLAVLPFKNNSPNPDDEYFASGLTDELVFGLQGLSLFSIISSDSTRQYRDNTDPRIAARDLGADYVIMGGVRRAGDRVRINAQLVDANSGMQAWANQFDGVTEDVFELQNRIAIEIVSAIEPEIFVQESRRVTQLNPKDMAAWDLYLRGQAEYYKMTYEGFSKAAEFWEQARAADADFVQPVAGLAILNLYFLLHHRGQITESGANEKRIKGFELATLAVQMDPQYSLGYAAMTGHLIMRNRQSEALQFAQQAKQMCPASARVHANLAFALFSSGKFREALEEYAKAQRLSPRDPFMAEQVNQQGACYFFLGEFDQALERANRSILLQGDYMWPHLFRTLSLSNLDQKEAAVDAMRDFKKAVPDFTLEQLGEIDPALGQVFIEGLLGLGWVDA